jgi:hypothetical protein
MDHTQLPPNGSLHTPFTTHSMSIKNPSLSKEVLGAPGAETVSKPFRDSPDPDQHLKDFDSLPSLTNGSSRGSRTPCPSEFEQDGPTTSRAMQCSYDSQFLVE